MKTSRKQTIAAALLVAALALTVAPGAFAAGTAACTVIQNSATLTYTVGGVDPTGGTGVSHSGGSGEQFTVGNKVVVTVEKKDLAAKQVLASSTTASLVAGSKYLSFTVTNGGNALQDYQLTVQNPAGEADPFGGNADSFDISGVTAYVDVNDDGVYDGGDTATSILGLDPTFAGAAGTGTRTVFIVPTGGNPAVPAGLSNGSTAVYVLKATTYKGSGTLATAETNTAGTIYKIGGGTCTADIVFADTTHASNATSGEANYDGKDTARNTFVVQNAVISIAKASAVVSDPVTGNTDGTFNATTWTACSSTCPKAIPGARVRYKISVSNAGGAETAVLSSISDALNANLQIVSAAAGASWAVAGSSRGTTNGTLTADNNAADGLAHSAPGAPGGTLTATLTTILVVDNANGYPTAGELHGGETVTLVFDATIQ